MNIEALRTEYTKLHADTEAMIAKVGTEKREFSTEEKTAKDSAFKRMATIKEQLDDAKKLAEMAFSTDAVTKPSEPEGKAEKLAIEVGQTFDATSKINKAEFSKAVTEWTRTGNMARQFATVTTATQSSLLLPVQVVEPFVPTAQNTFRQALTLVGLNPTVTTGTSEINIPVFDGTAGGVVAQDASSDTENVPTVTESILSKPATYQSGAIFFSNQQLAAVDFDLIGGSIPAMSYSKELGLESAAMTAILADQAITQTTATATTTTFTYANLVSLDNALPKRYQQAKVIILSQTAYAAACALTFASGPAVLTTDANGIRRFNGVPVLRSDYLQSLAAGHTVGLCISMAGFHLRDAGQPIIARYTQYVNKPNQTGVNLFGYHAVGYAPSAMVKFNTPAS